MVYKITLYVRWLIIALVILTVFGGLVDRKNVTTTAQTNASINPLVSTECQQVNNQCPSVERPLSTPSIITGIDANTATASSPLGQTGRWNLIFDDEFNSSTIDRSKWILCNPSYLPQSQCLPYNNESEIYNTALTANPNVYVSGGNLNLVATKQNSQIYSGMVSTGPNVFSQQQAGYKGFQFKYGYVEVSLKLPAGDGLWPAVWLLPDENKYGPWPESGEYDILEAAGNNPSTIYMTEHDGQNAGPGDEGTYQLNNATSGYHVFGFDWEPDHLAWYIDGKLARPMICSVAYAASNSDCDGYNNIAAIKDYPFFLIMNLAVGGDWQPLGAGVDASTPFPSTLSINWVRIWQHPAN